MTKAKENVPEKELNALLKGQYMGIHAYDEYIYRTKDKFVKRELQNIQMDHKKHAAMIAKRVQDLGGKPVNDEGIKGSVMQAMFKPFMPNTPDKLLAGSLKAEAYYGVEISEEIVKGDLDPFSRRIVHRVLNENRRHVRRLKKLVDKKDL